MTAFIGVCKAIYDYEPQTPEELAIKEDDLLYLLEKSNVDDWWTVKKRVIGSDAEEPVGLVPSTYVEPAPVISKVKAIYDYEEVQNPDEELTFHENDTFHVFDDKDDDWLLVQSLNSNAFGFVPGNYMEPFDGAASTGVTAPSIAAPAAIAPPVVTPGDIAALPPPPQHPNRSQSETPLPAELSEQAPPMPTRTSHNEDYVSSYGEEREDAPPPKPNRPTSAGTESNRERSRSRASYYNDEDDADAANGNHDNKITDSKRGGNDEYRGGDAYEERGINSQYHTWNVSEVDGRKKRKCKLSIGNNRIYFQPQKGTPQDWTIDKLTSYDNEKKHMFLEFLDPYKSLELHTGNNDTCQEIMTVIGEYKGVSRDPGLREVEMASKPKKQGNVLYDFSAESQDELTVKQGQSVYILNDKKSRDWWMCELVSTGKRGVVPAQFIEPVKEKSPSSGGLLNSIKKFTKSGSKSPTKSSGGGNNWKDDEEQGMASGSERRNRNRSRSNSAPAKKQRSASASNKKDFPDAKKTRIWADRSGSFKVDAQFIGCSDGKIHLHKANGVKIAVAAEKLSEEDLIYVERTTGFSLEKFRTKTSENKDARESERERRRRLREKDERERDRDLRERELEELKKARDLLDQERAKLHEKELPPIKPPRPQSTGPTHLSATATGSTPSMPEIKKNDYDWFEFFLNCGVDVSNCQRYTINFEREQITEDMMKDINSTMLRTLGLREGDIVRVSNYLDTKFGRNTQTQAQTVTATGGMFSEPDGSLKVASNGNGGAAPPAVAQQLLTQNTAPALSSAVTDDEAWTVRPAARSELNVSSNKSEFTGSMQDLLDLQPLEPKKKPQNPAPEPNLRDLEPVRTGNSVKGPISAVTTGGTNLVPLDPFKTGGHNLLPMATGFVMMPIATGGFMPMQRTGGFSVPQTSFGVQSTGNLMQPQRTSGGLMPISITGGFMPQTSFGMQPTGGFVPLQRTGGALPMSSTGGMLNGPPLGSVLPLQKTATGLMPANTTGGVLPFQRTGGTLPLQTTGGFMPLQRTGGGVPSMSFANTSSGVTNMLPQNSFPNQVTGNGYMMPQTTFGNQPLGSNIMPQSNVTGNFTGNANMLPQTSFANQLTGGANMIPQTTFANNMTGGMNMMPQTSFSNNLTGGAMMLPQTSFANQMTSGIPQTSFTAQQNTGGLMSMQRTGGIPNFPQAQSAPQLTGGAQFATGLPQNQFTGQPMQQFPDTYNTGVNNVTQGLQNTFISQPPLQTQPTGFGFGNGPQQQQSRQANLFNATADNPFGF